MSGGRRLDIAVGILRRADGAVLINQRQPGTHYAGWWEFPGGKLEVGESVHEALARELHEELGIAIGRSCALITLDWTYPERHVRLHTRVLEGWRGKPAGREGQAIAWVPPERLNSYQLLPADAPIVTALRLPAHYLITPDPSGIPGEDFLAGVEAACRRGIRLLRLRAHSLSRGAYLELAVEVQRVCVAHGCDLLLDRDASMVAEVGAAGLHLTSRALHRLDAGRIPVMKWLAASCHGPDDLRCAEQIGADFAVLSPLRRSPGHGAAIGWRQFARWTAPVNLPVYALGGLDSRHIDIAREHGGQGVAAVRGFWPDRRESRSA